MEGNNIKIGDKLYVVSCIDWSDFEIGEWIVEDSYDMAGIRMFRCRKCGELDEYLYFSTTSDDWIMRGGDDAKYVAFSQNDRELLYNYLVNRAEFEKLRIEKEIGLLTSKLNNLNQNIKSTRELRPL